MGHILKPRLGLRLNHNHPLAQGLVGCWLMNEGSGGKVYDLSGNGNVFQNSATVIWEDNGLRFDSNNYTSMGFESVQKLIGLTDEYSAVIACYFISRPDFTNYQLSTGKHPFDFKRNGYTVQAVIKHGDTETTLDSGVSVGNGQGANVAITGKSGAQKLYVNGVYKAGDTIVGTPNYGFSADTIYLGSSNGSSGIDGRIYYLYIYNRVLTASEIAQLHAEPYAMFEPDTGIWLRYYEAGGGAIIKVINETLQFSESVNKSMVAKKIINETLQLSESTLKLQDTKKVVNETLQLSESVEKKGATKKVVNETLQFSETLLKKGSIKKVINEVLQLSENILKKGRIVKVVNETLQLAENIVRKSGIIRIINEVLNISEGIVKALAVALGWREVIGGDSPITLVVSGTSTITMEVTGNSTITTEITGNSPLN